MTLVDVHRRQPSVIGLDDREIQLLIECLAHRKVDYVGMRRLCRLTGDDVGRDRYARQILELDLVRVKLGCDETKEEETGT